jgi:hypothetical protein
MCLTVKAASTHADEPLTELSPESWQHRYSSSRPHAQQRQQTKFDCEPLAANQQQQYCGMYRNNICVFVLSRPSAAGSRPHVQMPAASMVLLLLHFRHDGLLGSC